MKYVFYNPKANNGKSENAVEYVKGVIGECELKDVTKSSYNEVISTMNENDKIYIVGGDGTLNHFINAVNCDELKQAVYFYSVGTGNDFVRDLGVKESLDNNGIVQINKYIKNLPTVFVKDLKQKFINGIGYGLDGMCCQIGDDLCAKSTKEINYTSIAIKLLLFSYKPKNAKVKVDGKEYSFENVWILPTMKGRFYGGGLMVAPNQDRLNSDGTVSVVIYNGKSRLKSFFNFPKLSKGKHIKLKMVTVITGKDVYVEYDEPTALQIDGETVRDVLSYSVKA